MAPWALAKEEGHFFVGDEERRVLFDLDWVGCRSRFLQYTCLRLVGRTMLGTKVVGKMQGGIELVLDVVQIQT